MPDTTQACSVSAPVSQAAPINPLDQLGFVKHAAVCGLQFGDEGKGQIVDLLTQRYDLVVRYNGGANAGHSVQIGDQKFALHLIPSGILGQGTLNVVGNGVVIDPEQMLKEISGLRQRSVSVGDNLRISDRAHVVFPYHKLQDTLLDQALGQAQGDAKKIGTTGRGIGPCYADKALRSMAVRMGELLKAEHLRRKLPHIVEIKNLMLSSLAKKCGQDFKPFDPAALAEQYLAWGRELAPHICDTTALLHQALAQGRHLLFEGANAALLDIDHGTYPFVTSSSCSSLGVFSGAGVPGNTLGHVMGIVKLYTSRVGGGPFPTELHDATGQRIREIGNEFGTTTGRPRRTGWLDLVATRYTAALSGATAIACTGLSVLCGVEKLKVCVGYRYAGRELDHFPADIDVLAAVEPVYREFPGFSQSVDACRRFDELPAQAQAYVKAIEEYLSVPIRIICVGRRRDQIIVRN